MERGGFVWVWHPDAGEPTSSGPPWFDDVREGPRGSASAEMTWQVPLERVMEGMLDMHHAPFAHRRVMPTLGPRLDPFEVTAEGPDDVVARGCLRKESEPADGEHGMAFRLRVRFPGLMAGELMGMKLVVAMTPIDAVSTYIVYRYVSDVPLFGKLLAWLAVRSEDRFVQVDDQRLQESTRPRAFDRGANCYVPADAAFLAWHRLYRQALRYGEGSGEEPPPAAREACERPFSSHDSWRRWG